MLCALLGYWETKEVSYVTSVKQDPAIFNILIQVRIEVSLSDTHTSLPIYTYTICDIIFYCLEWKFLFSDVLFQGCSSEERWFCLRDPSEFIMTKALVFIL